MDLFTHASQQRKKSEAPLAARMRPRTLDEYVCQEDILGPGRLLRRAIEADRLFSSIILWGPPGTGKTTLAVVIANTTKSHFETLSAVLAGKAELRLVIDAVERRKLYQKKTVLFVKGVAEVQIAARCTAPSISCCPDPLSHTPGKDSSPHHQQSKSPATAGSDQVLGGMNW